MVLLLSKRRSKSMFLSMKEFTNRRITSYTKTQWTTWGHVGDVRSVCLVREVEECEECVVGW